MLSVHTNRTPKGTTMPNTDSQSPQVADFANLSDLNSQLWGASLRLASQAQDVAVLLIAKILRNAEPEAAHLELIPSDERPDGFFDGRLFAANGDILIDEGEDLGSLEGPEGSTNSVFGLVTELDKDAHWRRFVVQPHPDTEFGKV